MALLTKRPIEILARTLNYAGQLPTGATIDNVTLSAVKLSDGSDATDDVLVSETGSVVGSTVNYGIKGGVLEEDYEVTIVANLSSANRLEDVIVFGVRDLETATD
jgi:hypothetical protein